MLWTPNHPEAATTDPEGTHYRVVNPAGEPIGPPHETTDAAYDWLADNLSAPAIKYSLKRIPNDD